MGTRADFYVRKGRKLVQSDWIGSIAFDGYPEGIPDTIKRARVKENFIEACKKFFAERDDYTSPKDGWPWPWETSATSDYAYVFCNKRVVIHCFDKKCSWPNMKEIQNVQLGEKSGIIFIKVK